MASIAIVILNFNGEAHLKNFLPTVERHSQGIEIVVADNASTDGSITYLKKEHPKVSLIQLTKNHGFSGGYNEALKQIKSDYYVILNNDIEVTEGWLSPMISLLEEHPEISACQPKILSYHQKDCFEHAGAGGGQIDKLGYPFCRGRIFNSVEKDEGQYNDTKEIFWATGACLFIRSSVYHQHQGFAHAFFAHMEEIDLCWRIINTGGKIYYCGESTIFHVGGGTLHKSNPRKTYLNFRNNLSMLFRNISTVSFIIKYPIRIILDGIAALKFLSQGAMGSFSAVLRAHLYFIAIGLWRNLGEHFSKKDKTISKKLQYKKSIVLSYYLRKKTIFKDLIFKKNA